MFSLDRALFVPPQGSALEDAKKILMLAVQKLPANSRFNILAFGSQWLELFPSSVEKSEKSLREAAAFIKVTAVLQRVFIGIQVNEEHLS